MKTETIPHQPFRGLIARVAIQCTCPDTGHTGTFLFSGETWRAKGSRVSPVYDDCYEMLPAIRRDWAPAGDAYTFQPHGERVSDFMAVNHSTVI